MVFITDLSDINPSPPIGPRPMGRSGGGGRGRKSFEDALQALPQLREWTEGEWELEAAQKKEITELVKVTLKWENTYHRTFRSAEDDARLLTPKTTREQLRADMMELLQRVTLLLSNGLKSDPSWAAGSLALLVDDYAKLYNNRVTTYGGGTGSFTVQEGADFLMGVAATTFYTAGGFDALMEAMQLSVGDVVAINQLVDLVQSLSWSKQEPDKEAVEALYAAAGEALLAVSEKGLVEKKDDAKKVLSTLLMETTPVKGEAKPASRVPIEAAWQRSIVIGLRSTNLQARRAAADALADASRRGITAAALAPWLRQEKVLEELFGDRLDPRVLEELSLEPLCEPSVEGLRVLLAELERNISHSVLYKKLHQLVIAVDDAAPPAWGRDLVTQELMRWARRLLAAGRQDALALLAGIFSCAERGAPGSAKTDWTVKRIFAFIFDELAVSETIEAMVEALASPNASPAHVVAIEAAFDDLRHFDPCRAALAKLLERYVGIATDASKCMELAPVRLLFRILQCYPAAAEKGGPADFTREAALARHEGLNSILLAELKRYVSQGEIDDSAMRWRIRLLCFVYRCSPALVMGSAELKELWDLLRPLKDGAFLCYLLRIASTAERMASGETGTNSAFSNEALFTSLEMLEEWAVSSGGLNPAAFFCLCQAIALVNDQLLQLVLADERGEDFKAQHYIMNGVHELAESEKGPPVQMVGRWVKILQVEGYHKLARLGKYDEVTEMMSIEYIDESIHRRKLSGLASVKYVAELAKQELACWSVKSVKDPEVIKGVRGLWACALGADSTEVAQRATEMLLAIHQGPDGTRSLLKNLLGSLRAGQPPGNIGRGLTLMETLVWQQPLAQRRSHIGCGFPFRLRVYEYTYVWEEVPKKFWQIGPGQSRTETVQKRKQVGYNDFDVHSQMTASEFFSMCAQKLGKRNIELSVRDLEVYITAFGQQTLEELEIGFGKAVEAEPTYATEKSPAAGPLDDLGSQEGAPWLERLLELVNSRDLGASKQLLCWQLLLYLPTHAEKAEQVQSPSGRDWKALLSHENIWHSAYVVLLIAAQMAPLSSENVPAEPELSRTTSAVVAQAVSWASAFADAGGAQALIELFIAFVTARISDAIDEGAEFELIAVLPHLMRAVGFCVLSGGGGKDSLGKDGGLSLVQAATQATKWLFDKSKALPLIEEEDQWSRMRLRHAAANGLELLVFSQRIAELPIDSVDRLVLPLLCSIAGQVEGHVNARVVAAIVEVSRRDGATPLILKRIAAAVPAAAQAAGSGPTPFFDIALEAIITVGQKLADEAIAETGELAVVVARAALDAKKNAGSLFRLLRALLQICAGSESVAKLVEEAGTSLTDRMMGCLMPEQAKNLDDDYCREQAAEALLYVLDAGDFEMRHTVLKRVVGYLAASPTPAEYDFVPEVPKQPGTSLDARRNDTGHVGLLNRGMTCYMNSTVQQLFWSVPFRNAILSAPPAVPDEVEKPAPLPDPLEKKKKEAEAKKKSKAAASSNVWSFLGGMDEPEDADDKKTPAHVAWQMQRMFTYLQDCQLGQFNTDTFVKACSCLNLEYRVTQQNDAAEFLDKVLDAVDTGLKGSVKPASVFTAKTCREKCCHACGFRTRGSEDEMKRVQLNTLCDTLEECLDELTASETMSGDNRVDCDNCGPKRDTTYRTFFTQLPQVLVLNLARITFDLETLERVKKNPRIAFPMKINMSKYTEDGVVNSVESVPGCSYELQGVQIHQGSAGSGHYYSYVQDEKGQWIKFNDDRVAPFDVAEEIEEECFGGEDYERQTRSGDPYEKSYNAYMLYYRCVDATPFRSGQKPAADAEAAAVAAPAATLHRSISEQPSLSPGAGGPKPVGLTRNVTQAFGGERLIERQKQHRQAQAKADLQEDIDSTNTKLHRQAVVFSRATVRFALLFLERLFNELRDGADAAVGAPAAGNPAAAAKALQSKASAVEGLCRLTCKIIFDVLLHAQGCNKALLKPWCDDLVKQFGNTSGVAAQWFCHRLGGEPDAVLGRDSGAWLPKVLFKFGRHGERFPCIVSIMVSAADCAVSAGGSAAEGCTAFLEALLVLMSSVEGVTGMSRYGQIWAELCESPVLGPFVAAHRGQHAQPVSSLLVHLFIGNAATPLQAPPAPPLPTGSAAVIPKSRTEEAYGPLLKAFGALLSVEPKLGDERIVRSAQLWKQLVRRCPEVFLSDSPLRQAMPEDDDVLKQVAQTICEGLRPTGTEDILISTRLRIALAYVLRSGGPGQLMDRLAMLAELGRKLQTLAKTNSGKVTSYSGFDGGSGGSGGGGGRRLETLDEDSTAVLLEQLEQLEKLRALDIGTSSDRGGSQDSDSFRVGGDSALIQRRRGGIGGNPVKQGVGFASDTKFGKDSDSKATRNPEALQLFRLLQVVAQVSPTFPDSWAWAKEWLGEVTERKNELRWQGEGLPIKEVKELCAELGIVAEKAAENSGEGKTGEEDEIIEISGGGHAGVNGQYVFQMYDDQGCPHYINVEDDNYALYREKNRLGDIRWVIAFLDPVLDGEPEPLYRTNYQMTQRLESPWPPEESKDWSTMKGLYPPPSVKVVLERS